MKGGKCLLIFAMMSLLLLVGCKANSSDNAKLEPTHPSSPSVEELKSMESNVVVFKNVNLITMLDDQVLENYTVVIRDGVIAEIGEGDAMDIPEVAQVIEGADHYLLPGLVDMHVHINFFRHEEILYLANGVTSIMNMWGRQDILNTRDINNRRDVGLRIFSTGPIMDGPNPIWKNSMVLATPEEVDSAVIRVKEQGYEAVKVYELLSSEVYAEIMKTATANGIKVMGHVPRDVGIREVLEQGQSSIEHLSGYTVSNIEEMAELTAKHNVWNTPTLAIDHINIGEHEINGLEYVHPNTLLGWRNMKAAVDYEALIEKLENRQSLIQTIHLKGGKLLAGTDANNPFVVPGFSLHSELEYLAGSGLSPFEVLKTTTYNPAAFLGKLDQMGTVEVGKLADLILLSENPLIDIKNTQSIQGTMIRGVWMSKEKLHDDLEKLKENF